MALKIAKTPDGTVIREILPSGEHAYRVTDAGEWHHCADHKGPWLIVPFQDVPKRIRTAAYS